MVNSMTAFSKKEMNCTWGRASWEIRSVNQRYLDINVNLPPNFNDLLWTVRTKIKNSLFRGKIECNLQIDINYNQCDTFTIDKQLISSLISTAKWIQKQTNEGEINPIGILCYPGVISYKQHNIHHLNNELLISFDKTLEQLIQHRQKEGSFLKEKIIEKLHYVHNKIDSINQYLPNVLIQKKKKFLDLVQDFSENISSAKLDQELLIILHKIDISEEIDRLFIHVKEMNHILSQEGPIGRRLDFITQELQRESNTLTAKSVDSHITHLAISLKVLIEQIREQIQNIE